MVLRCCFFSYSQTAKGLRKRIGCFWQCSLYDNHLESRRQRSNKTPTNTVALKEQAGGLEPQCIWLQFQTIYRATRTKRVPLCTRIAWNQGSLLMYMCGICNAVSGPMALTPSKLFSTFNLEYSSSQCTPASSSTASSSFLISSRSHVCHQMSIKRLAPNRHLQLIERILRHIIRIQFVQLPYHYIDVWLVWFRE